MMELLPILSIANHYVTDNLFIHGGNEDLRSAGCILMFSHKGSDINDIEASNVFNSLRNQPRDHVRKKSVAISGYTNGVGSQNQSTIDINNLAFQQSKYLHLITI